MNTFAETFVAKNPGFADKPVTWKNLAAVSDGMLDAIIETVDRVADRVNATSRRLDALEQASGDSTAQKDELAALRRKVLDLEAELERAAERADLNRKGLQMSLDQAVSDLRGRG